MVRIEVNILLFAGPTIRASTVVKEKRGVWFKLKLDLKPVSALSNKNLSKRPIKYNF